MKSVPFEIDNLNGGFMKLDGILRLEKTELIFEFQMTDAFMEAYKSDLTELHISLFDLSSSEFKKGFFSSKLILHASRAAVFQKLPGNDLTVRKLKVKKKNSSQAAAISSEINILLSEKRLKDMEE